MKGTTARMARGIDRINVPLRFHSDGDLIGIERRLVWNVVRVAKQQLQGMLTRWQFDASFGLAAAKMQVVFVVGNFTVECRQLSIDEHVMVTGVGLVDPGRRHSGPR